jgi:hypothetical protein
MNCVELHESLVESDGGNTAEQRAHLKTCPDCSALLQEINLIAAMAVELRAVDEPSPRVWKSIESNLRREGLVRPQRTAHSLLPSFTSPWAFARWMVPAAAALLIGVGIYARQHSPDRPVAGVNVASTATIGNNSDPQIAGLNDDELLQEVSEQSPAMKEQYAENLRRVNQYIQDEKGVVASDPNDEEARRSLMEAYQQKAMLFELALDRSLP